MLKRARPWIAWAGVIAVVFITVGFGGSGVRSPCDRISLSIDGVRQHPCVMVARDALAVVPTCTTTSGLGPHGQVETTVSCTATATTTDTKTETNTATSFVTVASHPTITTADAFGSNVRRAYPKSGLKLTGTVLTPTGGNSVHTRVSVDIFNAAGQPQAVLASTTTGAHGHYKLFVPRGRSRVLTLVADNNLLRIVEYVSPSVSLHLHARRRAVLILWGKLRAGAGPMPTVVLQDRAPNGWQDFSVASVGIRGGWRAIYHSAKGTAGRRFAIRAVTTEATGLLPATSKTHMTRVR